MSEEEIKEYTLKFHNTYERLAPNYGYETRKDTKEFDFNSNNGKLMYATVSEIISPLLQKVEEKNKEIDRLNNILSGLEKYTVENIAVLENRLNSPFCNFEKVTKELLIFQNYLDKLKELKENK